MTIWIRKSPFQHALSTRDKVYSLNSSLQSPIFCSLRLFQVYLLLGMHLLIAEMFSPKLNGCLLYATPDCRPIIVSACERCQSVIPEIIFTALRTRFLHIHITGFCFGWQTVVKSAFSLLSPLKWLLPNIALVMLRSV